MSGSKTRFGFVGGSDPPDAEAPQSARTVYGRDLHLQLPPGLAPPQPAVPTPLPPAPARWTPAAPVRAPMPEQESTNRISVQRTTRPRKSRLARFLGHWTRSGRFESASQMNIEDDLELPRDTTGRNVLIVLLVAGLTFLITFAIVKLRQRSVEPPAPAAQTTSQAAAPVVPAAPPTALPAQATPPAAAPPPAAAAPAAVAPLAPPPPTQPAANALLPAAAKGLGATAPVRAARKPTPASRYLAAPPEHLKNDLLPINP